jgi:hypothetical protein
MMPGGLQRILGNLSTPSFGLGGSRRIAGVRYHEIVPPLPLDDTVLCPNRFQFGIPWPWEESHSPAGIVSGTGEDVAVVALTQVDCPRTDGEYVGFGVWSEDGIIDIPQFGRQANQQFSRLYRGKSEGSLTILLDGARAIVTVTSTSDEQILRVTSEWHDRSLHAEFRSPVRQAESYKPHFETIIGSWSWM